MKHYPYYVQENENEIEVFIQEMKMATLLTFEKEQNVSDNVSQNDEPKNEELSTIQSGVFNPLYVDRKFYLHLNRSDEQFRALESNPEARLIYFDFLCNIPSYWIDTEDGGMATSYYRHLDLYCHVKIYKDPKDVALILPKFLEKFQPEGGYTPLSLDHVMYQSDYKILGIVELTPIWKKAKWKLAQNRSIEKRMEVIQKLRDRNEGHDLKAALEIERWIKIHQK